MRAVGAAGVAVVLLATLTGADVPAPGASQDPPSVVDTASEPLRPGRPGGTLRLIIGEPASIGPSTVGDTDGLQVVSYLFTGLVTVAPDGTVSAGVAHTWSADAGCKLWTFRLKHGTRFHNGEEVTSQSFQRAWARAAPGAFLHDELVWMDAAEPYTLRVLLVRGDCEFPQRMTNPVFSPVPSVAGPPDDPAFHDRPVGNGPFRMDGPWRHDQRIRLVRSEEYTLGPEANLDAVELTISVNPTADSRRAFRAGEVDWARLPVSGLGPPQSLDEFAGKLISGRVDGTNYLLPAVTTKPLDSAAARKAISLAIDREAIMREEFGGRSVLATSLVPPPLRDPAEPPACTACRYDPAEARRLARIAGLTAGTVLHFRYNDRGGHEAWSATVKRQLETTLGIKVNYYNLPFAEMLANEQAPGASGIWRAAWGLDFPSTGNMLSPLLSTAAIGTLDPDRPATGDNHGRYSNPRVDRLLDQARVTPDKTARMALYTQAERIAIGEDLALIPLWYRHQYRLAARDRFVNLRVDWYGNADLAVAALK